MYRACWRLVYIGKDGFSRLIILCLYDDRVRKHGQQVARATPESSKETRATSSPCHPKINNLAT